MREKIILICEVCLSRNYTTTKNKTASNQRLEIKKFCPVCNKHTLHKETKQEEIMAIKEKVSDENKKSRLMEILGKDYIDR